MAARTGWGFHELPARFTIRTDAEAAAACAELAARALAKYTSLGARQIAEEAMQIAGKICIYTNQSVTVEEL